jgi:hypothetical protein
MTLHHRRLELTTRRQFLTDSGRFSLGAIALQSLLGKAAALDAANPLASRRPPLSAKAKSVIYLSMSGAPPQHDLFDWKPELKAHHLQPCPDHFLKGEKFAFIKELRSSSVLHTISHSTARAGHG